MDEYVKRSAIIGKAHKMQFSRLLSQDEVDMIERVVNDVPTEDVEKVRHGYWSSYGEFEQCSFCKATHLKILPTYYGKATWVKTLYCPACGAKMDGGEDE